MNPKLVLTYHSSPTTKSFVQRSWMTRLAVEHYSIVTTPFELTAEMFSDFGVRTEAIPNIISIDNWPFRQRRQFEPKFVWTRNTYFPELAVSAFKLVMSQYPDATLTMCGKAAKPNGQFGDLQQPGLDLMGLVPRSKLVEILDRSDIYLNTMGTDSFGYAVYEALAMGLIVVSVYSESLDSIVGSDVIYFSDDDTPQSLADSILQTLSNQEETIRRTSLGKDIVGRLDWANLYQRWKAIYVSL